MKFRLLRHATLLIEVGGKKILLDPMLSKKEALDPVGNAANSYRFPLVELPVSDDELLSILKETDAVIVTHTHRDHWDVAAQQLINKNKLIICQPVDEATINAQGFLHVQPVENSFSWKGIHIYRTGGQHGTGETGKKMGAVSGFVIEYDGPRLYVAGDTIWCREVRDAVTTYHPSHIIVNAGGARFLEGDAITMTVNDVLELSKLTDARIDIVHLETVNHCLEKRPAYREAITKHSLENQVSVPGDGDWINI